MRSYLVLCSALLSFSSLASASVDNGLLAMVSAETILLTSVDVSRTAASPFGQYLLKRINSDGEHFKQMIADTGFDPRRDLQHIVFAGLTKPGTPNGRFVILARGTFDTAHISAAAKAHGAKVISDSSGNAIYVPSGGQGHPFAFAFPDTGLAVMGDLASVQAVLAHRATPTTVDPQLMDFAYQIGANNDVWFATLMSGAFLGASSGTAPGFQNAQALQSILQSAGGMQFGDTVNMVFDATTRSPEDATSLADVLRFVGNMVQMQASNDPRSALAAAALQNLQVQANGANVHATVAITEDKLEQLAREPAGKGGR